MIVLGYIGQNHSWGFAFALAGVIQLIGILPFRAVIKSPVLANSAKFEKKKESEVENRAPLKKHEKQRIVVICVLAVFSILFWAAYNQSGSSMTLYALRYTDRNVLGFQMPPSWLLSAESIYLVILAFPLTWMYQYLARRKKDPSPPLKSAIGLIIMSLCFLVMVIGSLSIPVGATEASVSPWYLLVAYFLMALAEMLITPIGLALITHLSPHRYTALLVGVWYACIGIGFYLGGITAGFMGTALSLAKFFSINMYSTLIPAIILMFLIKKLNKMRRLDTL